MGVSAKRGISLSLPVMMIMIFLLNISSSSAAATTTALYNKSNNNDTACLIADDKESEFLMDSDISRRMMPPFPQVTANTKQKNQPVFPMGNKIGKQQHCEEPFLRVCHRYAP